MAGSNSVDEELEDKASWYDNASSGMHTKEKVSNQISFICTFYWFFLDNDIVTDREIAQSGLLTNYVNAFCTLWI